MTYWQPVNKSDVVADVSHHNGDIDWARVAGSAIRAVFIKATQGASGRDPKYVDNRLGASSSGLLVSAYHFLTEDDPASQHRNFMDMTGGTVPLMIDWEVDPSTGRRAPIALMEQFCRLVRTTTSRDPLAYHGMYDLSSPAINAYPWMVPKYGPQPQGPRWLFWQYTSTGSIPGIPSAGEDRSVFAGTGDELRAWWTNGTMPAGFDAPAAPQPVAPVSSVAEAERQLQHALQLAGKYNGAIDGKFGQNSLGALAKVDPTTAGALATYRGGRWNV